jgi:hypothetical protein
MLTRQRCRGMIKSRRRWRLELSDCRDLSQRQSPCNIELINDVREIERKKEDVMPKRGDFFHVKIHR